MSVEEKKALERRTKVFALKAIVFVGTLPRTRVTDVLGGQFLKAATSIGANYREANRAESRNDFIHKIGLAEKEAAESLYWLELLDESGLGEEALRAELLRESFELPAIFTRIGKTAKLRRSSARSS